MHCLTWGAAIIDWFEHSHDQFDASEYLHIGVMLNKYFCVFPFLHFYYLTQNSGHNWLDLFLKQFFRRNFRISVTMRDFINSLWINNNLQLFCENSTKILVQKECYPVVTCLVSLENGKLHSTIQIGLLSSEAWENMYMYVGMTCIRNKAHA